MFISLYSLRSKLLIVVLVQIWTNFHYLWHLYCHYINLCSRVLKSEWGNKCVYYDKVKTKRMHRVTNAVVFKVGHWYQLWLFNREILFIWSERKACSTLHWQWLLGHCGTSNSDKEYISWPRFGIWRISILICTCISFYFVTLLNVLIWDYLLCESLIYNKIVYM